MNGRIDPAAALGDQNTPLVRSNRVSDGIRGEFHFESGEVLHDECRKITVLSKREQVLLVQSVHVWLRVLVNHSAGDDDRSSLVGCSDSVDTEAPGETRHRSE